MNLALNYGSRRDVSKAIKKIILQDREQPFDLDNIEEEFLRDFFDTIFNDPFDYSVRAGNRGCQIF